MDTKLIGAGKTFEIRASTTSDLRNHCPAAVFRPKYQTHIKVTETKMLTEIQIPPIAFAPIHEINDHRAYRGPIRGMLPVESGGRLR